MLPKLGLSWIYLNRALEAALIDAFPGLTNLVGGHGTSIFGCRSVYEIVHAYKAPPLCVEDPLILIFVGRALDEKRDLYDAVRGVWRMSRRKAEEFDLVLAHDGVLVRGAYRPNKPWLQGTVSNFPFLPRDMPSRIGFTGERHEKWERYVGRRVPPPKRGAQTPFRYLEPAAQSGESIEVEPEILPDDD